MKCTSSPRYPSPASMQSGRTRTEVSFGIQTRSLAAGSAFNSGPSEPDQGGCEHDEADPRRRTICIPEGGGSTPCGPRVSGILDAARGDEDRRGDDGSGEGGQRRKPPKEVSLTDPQATWLRCRAWTRYLPTMRTTQSITERHYHRCCGQSDDPSRGDCCHPDHGAPARAAVDGFDSLSKAHHADVPFRRTPSER
jgi:hypothetical protein